MIGEHESTAERAHTAEAWAALVSGAAACQAAFGDDLAPPADLHEALARSLNRAVARNPGSVGLSVTVEGKLPSAVQAPTPTAPKKIAALFVETGGCYFGRPDVDPWDEELDARLYSGPHPVVAHPPCQRWGRFWHGSTRKPHQYSLGDDGGCFQEALSAVRLWGGVLEHPADSKAWAHFNLNPPKRGEGWIRADMLGGWTCYVEQGHYGHASRKPTWLYAFGVDLPELIWTRGAQRIPQWMLDRYGYESARRIGVVAMIGGKDKTRKRNATPTQFRNLLISIAQSAMVSS